MVPQIYPGPCGYPYAWMTVGSMNLKEDISFPFSETFLRERSSSRQVVSLVFTHISLPDLRRWLLLMDRDQGGNSQNFLPDQTWQWGNGCAEPQGLLPVAIALHNTSPKTVEKNSLKPILWYFLWWISFIMDSKMNENTSKDNNDF